MKQILHIQKFIAENSNWEELLQAKPYCITVSRDTVFGHNLVMFKYSQIDSDFNNPIVRECRGLILDEKNFEVVCHPFDKFGNYGESYCPKIDWKSCYVTEKLDGSLIKLVRIGDDILWSTNGTIDAFKANLAEQIGCIAKSFGQLAWWAAVDAWLKAKGLPSTVCVDEDIVNGWLKSIIKPGFTYMFELTSPYNKVVVTWHKTELHFIGCRNNETGQEIFFGDHELAKVFDTPKVFPLRSVDECVAAAAKLDVNAEGYVVVDKDFNRVKIKSPTYVALHHMKNNGVLSYARGIEIVRGNELGEVLTYFPEFKPHLEKIKECYDKYIADLNAAQILLDNWICSNGYAVQKWYIQSGGQKRKDLAIFVMNNIKKFSGFAFAYVDGKINSMVDGLKNTPSKNLIIELGFKE